MQITIDGYVATVKNEPVRYIWDEELRNYSIACLENVGTILLGRKTAADFIPYWSSVTANSMDPDYKIAKLLTDIPKIIFSKKTKQSMWSNATMANGDFVNEIEKLRKEKGNDLIVYGGASFASSLITKGIVDEYHLLVNPVVTGSGISIFKQFANLILIEAIPFGQGLVVLKYKPSSNRINYIMP